MKSVRTLPSFVPQTDNSPASLTSVPTITLPTTPDQKSLVKERRAFRTPRQKKKTFQVLAWSKRKQQSFTASKGLIGEKATARLVPLLRRDRPRPVAGSNSAIQIELLWPRPIISRQVL